MTDENVWKIHLFLFPGDLVFSEEQLYKMIADRASDRKYSSIKILTTTLSWEDVEGFATIAVDVLDATVFKATDGYITMLYSAPGELRERFADLVLDPTPIEYKDGHWSRRTRSGDIFAYRGELARYLERVGYGEGPFLTMAAYVDLLRSNMIELAQEVLVGARAVWVNLDWNKLEPVVEAINLGMAEYRVSPPEGGVDAEEKVNVLLKEFLPLENRVPEGFRFYFVSQGITENFFGHREVMVYRLGENGQFDLPLCVLMSCRLNSGPVCEKMVTDLTLLISYVWPELNQAFLDELFVDVEKLITVEVKEIEMLIRTLVRHRARQVLYANNEMPNIFAINI